MKLDAAALVALLDRAPKESLTLRNARTQFEESQTVLSLPLPGGGYARFSLIDSPVLEPSLATRFPEIRSFRGQGIDDPRATVRGDWSPRGFNATILLDSTIISVHPAAPDDTSTYVSYRGEDFAGGVDNFECGVEGEGHLGAGSLNKDRQNATASASLGPTLRTFRIAIATSQEYTNAAGLGGGTVAGTVASLNTWLNAVNLIYERELSTRFILVNNTNIIFTAEPDGLTNNSNSASLAEIKPILESKVGLANYDIGHVLTYAPGGGGLANVGVVCRTDNLKGGGVTSVGAPAGNYDGIHVLSHELGHQFGAGHTYNGCAGSESGRAPSSAYEVGSGLTIMSYGGVCGTDNIVPSRGTTELRFHSGTFAQINSYLAATSCAVPSATGNNPTTVDAGINYTIPKLTPFTLTASASDPDAGDMPNLTYAWEQYDVGGAAYANPPYEDTEDSSTTTRPIFRPYSPTTDPTRTFPKLSYILDYANDPPATLNSLRPGEELPRIGRTLNFRVTARDNRSGGGGINDDSVALTVDGNSGPFALTAPNAAASWPGGSTQTVAWAVNNTNVAPVNATSVKILLSTDGGQTFPNTLAASTANDGSETVTVPNGVQTSAARVKVQAIGNIFFDISDANFTVTPSGTCPLATSVSPGAGNAGSSVTITGVNFTGVNAVKFPNNVSAAFTVNSDTQITATVPAGAATGPITLEESGCTGALTPEFTVCPAAPVALAVDDGSINNLFSGPTHWVNRLTPTSYPATLTHVTIYWYGSAGSGPPVNTPVTILAGTNTDGDASINGTSFQQVSGTVQAQNNFQTYQIAPVTITQGDFVVGFQMTPAAGLNPLSSDTNDPDNGRSYNGNGVTFSLHADQDYMIRGQYSVGCDVPATLSPSSQAFNPSGGSGVIGVSEVGAWTAVSNDSWITVTSGASGTNGGTVVYTVANNTDAARTGTLTVAGRTFTVTQDACAYTITPASRTHDSGAGTGTIDVGSSGVCAWSATSNAAWLSPAYACQSDPVALSVDDGGINLIGGSDYVVNRLTPASYPATLTHVSVYWYGSANGGPALNTPLTILAGTNADGDATINNTSFQQVAGTVQTQSSFQSFEIAPITITSGDFVVGYTMAAGAATYRLAMDANSPAGRSYFSSNGTSFVAEASVNYMIRGQHLTNCVSPAGAAGSGKVVYSVAANDPGGAARSGTLTVAGHTFTVTQPCTPAATPTVTVESCATSATLTSSAAPAGYAYQWYKDGSALAGETNRTLSATSAGQYAVGFTGACPSALSAASSVSFNLPAVPPTADTGTGLTLDGANDYVNVPHSSSLLLGNSFTLEFWTKTSYAGGGFKHLIRKEVGYGVDIIDNNDLLFFTWGDDARFNGVFLNDGQWHHYALVASGGNNKRVYRDGVMVGEDTSAYVTDQGANPLRISWPSNSFPFTLDELRVWNTARTQSEIVDHRFATFTCFPASLVLYLPFENGTAGGNNSAQTTTPDHTPYANSGTLINFTLSGTTSNYTDATKAAATMLFSSAAYSISEAGASAIVAVNRTGDTASAVSVNYAASNNTASAGSDYGAVSGTLNFASGETGKTFNVPIYDDGVYEGAETVTLTLSSPAGGAVLGTPATATLTITDDEMQPALSVGDASVPEPTSGQTYASFPITLSVASAQTVTVNYDTADGTAAAPGDYTAASGTATFSPGETSKLVSVGVNTDAVSEGPETFSFNLSNPSNATVADGAATGTITPPVMPGAVIISEFRMRGPSGETDEFVELYNNTGADITVTDANPLTCAAQLLTGTPCGWALVDLYGSVSNIPRFVVPVGTVIPARGHYLAASAGYSLSALAAANLTYNPPAYSGGESDSTGLALYKTADRARLTTQNVIDSAGFDGVAVPYREGNGLLPADGVTANVEHSFARRFNPNGFPQDTGDNASDFWLVAPDPADLAGTTVVLGAPAPENLAGPVNHTSTLKSSLIEPASGSLGGANALRDSTPGAPDSSTAFGTLSLRRRFTNTTGGTVTHLRLRITNLTTINSPGAGTSQADLRALTSLPQSVAIDGMTIDIRRATLETPPAQAKGGGYNSSLLVDVPGGSMVNGASVTVNITFGVAKRGSFQLSYIVEAVSTPSPVSRSMKSDLNGGRKSRKLSN